MRTAAAALAMSLLASSAIAATTCRYHGYLDGCPNVGTRSFFLGSDLHAAAAVDGQAWKILHPPWNVPSIDYQIGPRTDVTLRDASDPTSLPSGCTLGPRPGTASGVQWFCTAPAGQVIVAENYDFTVHGCMEVQFRVNNQANVQLRGNKMCVGPGNSVDNGAVVLVQAAGPLIDIENTQIDGNGTQFPASMTLVTVTAPKSVLVYHRNATTAPAGRHVTANVLRADERFSAFIDTNCAPNNGMHGEIGLVSPQPETWLRFGFNLVVFGKCSQANTTTVYGATGAANIVHLSVDHNVIVSNHNGTTGAATVSALAVELASTQTSYPGLVLIRNHLDPSGSLYCLGYPFSGDRTGWNISGNVNMLTGGALNTLGLPVNQGCP